VLGAREEAGVSGEDAQSGDRPQRVSRWEAGVAGRRRNGRGRPTVTLGLRREQTDSCVTIHRAIISRRGRPREGPLVPQPLETACPDAPRLPAGARRANRADQDELPPGCIKLPATVRFRRPCSHETGVAALAKRRPALAHPSRDRHPDRPPLPRPYRRTEQSLRHDVTRETWKCPVAEPNARQARRPTATLDA
jgi:hypothetical protein